MTETASESSGPLLLTLKLAAERLGVPDMQVKHLVDDGLLPFTRIKNRTYIPAQALRDYTASIGQAS